MSSSSFEDPFAFCRQKPPWDVIVTNSMNRQTDVQIAVVVVNYNSWDDVTRLVSALEHSPHVSSGRCEIVVVDNCSEGRVPEAFLSHRPGVRVILRDDNGGFAVGVNAGWRATNAPWLLLLNPDVEIDPSLIENVLRRVDRDIEHGGEPPAVVGFGLRNADGTWQPSVGVEPGLLQSLRGVFIPRSRRKYQAGWRTKPGPVPWVTGACALVDAAALARVGGMDEDFFLYYEEVALCRGFRALGRRVEFDPAIEVVHARPLQNRAITPKMRVITRHSQMLYFLKHRPRWEFQGLAWIVQLEAVARGAWAALRGLPADASAWKTIRAMASAARRGSIVRGRQVLALAEQPASPPGAPLDAPSAEPHLNHARHRRAADRVRG